MLSFPEERRSAFDALFAELRRTHKLDTEQKWEAIGNGYSRINFLLDWLYRILVSSAATFDIIVVHKCLYRRWNEIGGDREKAFYITYTQVLTSAAKRTGEEMRVFIDDRSDEYARHAEVVQIVGNNTLKDLADAGRLGDVTKVKFKGRTCDTSRRSSDRGDHRGPSGSPRSAAGMHSGKRVAIARAAEVLGWTDLVCDTMPGSPFNIWHFPIEYRATPSTRSVGPIRMPRHVTKADLQVV